MYNSFLLTFLGDLLDNVATDPDFMKSEFVKELNEEINSPAAIKKEESKEVMSRNQIR